MKGIMAEVNKNNGLAQPDDLSADSNSDDDDVNSDESKIESIDVENQIASEDDMLDISDDEK